MGFLPRLFRRAAPNGIAAALRGVLSNGAARPHRRVRRRVLERAYLAAREDFAREIETYLEPLSQSTIMRDFNSETITRLNKKASLFASDRGFKRIWTMFWSHYVHEAAVAYFDLDREVDEEQAIQVGRNLNHCFQVRHAIATALVENLAGVEGHEAKLQARLAELTAKYEALGMVDLLKGAPPAVPPPASSA